MQVLSTVLEPKDTFDPTTQTEKVYCPTDGLLQFATPDICPWHREETYWFEETWIEEYVTFRILYIYIIGNIYIYKR